MTDSKEKEYKWQEQAEELQKWRALSARKNFDYQERWHGWRSPVGLSLGFAVMAAGLFLLSLAWANLVQ